MITLPGARFGPAPTPGAHRSGRALGYSKPAEQGQDPGLERLMFPAEPQPPPDRRQRCLEAGGSGWSLPSDTFITLQLVL